MMQLCAITTLGNVVFYLNKDCTDEEKQVWNIGTFTITKTCHRKDVFRETIALQPKEQRAHDGNSKGKKNTGAGRCCSGSAWATWV